MPLSRVFDFLFVSMNEVEQLLLLNLKEWSCVCMVVCCADCVSGDFHRLAEFWLVWARGSGAACAGAARAELDVGWTVLGLSVQTVPWQES